MRYIDDLCRPLIIEGNFQVNVKNAVKFIIMKIFNSFLLLSISLFLSNCGNDDENSNDKLIFNASNLKQTGWKGEILLLSNWKVDSRGDISVEFKTEDTRVCECKLDYFIDPEVYSFVYEIKDLYR